MRRVLVLGGTYGSLFATKLLLAGHAVTIVCRASEAEQINSRGTIVRLPVKGHSRPVEISSSELAGHLMAQPPDAVDLTGYDLAVLAVQEPQLASPGLRDLGRALAASNLPCLSIMNMPPLPFLARLPGIDLDACQRSYRDPDLWLAFDPDKVTTCSPDPQAFHPAGEPENVLEVGLPTNFKAAPFDAAEDTQLLQELEDDIDNARFSVDGSNIEVPVKLRVRTSLFIPMAKWCMLLAGNYRCIQDEGIRSIKDAVHSDQEATREVYDFVAALCRVIGATDDDLVPFEKYSQAASSLTRPSSVARSLAGGAPYLERVDLLVQALAAQKGMHCDGVDEIVQRVDAKLQHNRRQSRSQPNAS